MKYFIWVQALRRLKIFREFIYTYILPEPDVDIEFLQKDMRELERLQEILQEAQDREVLLKEINEKLDNNCKVEQESIKAVELRE